MKNFKVMMVATLLMSGFALQAADCPFTLINRTDGVIHPNIGEQMATISEWFSPYGYKTIQPGKSKCFYMGPRSNGANKLYIRYQGTMPNRSLYPAHEFIINLDDRSLAGLDNEGYLLPIQYSIRDLFTTIDPKVAVIGEKAMLGDAGEAQIVFFGKAVTEHDKIEDAVLILYSDKHFETKIGEKLKEFKQKYNL